MRTQPLITHLLHVLFLAASTFIHAVTADVEVDHGKEQIEWLRSRGGFVSSKIEIRNNGMFAIGDFEQGEDKVKT